MIRTRSTVAAAVALGLGLSVTAGIAQATYTQKSYDVVVPKFNGSGWSGQQTKTDAYEDGHIYSSGVGGSYNVDARLENANGAAAGSSWVRVGDTTSADLPNLINKGWSTRVKFSNDLGTRVNVQVLGKFIAR